MAERTAYGSPRWGGEYSVVRMTQQVEQLFERRRLGIKPGLESERRLLEGLGNPESSFAAVHVAGTNGKGSVAAMLASVLSAAGYRTGLFTSPHLVHLNERFRVNGEMIDDAGLGGVMDRVEAVASGIDLTQEGRVTFFECCAAMAFEHFRNCGVQLAVLETGMGGRLDATNVVTPAVSVITRIALDHSEYLGHDLATIAGEKGGIIKPGRPVVIGAMPAEAREVLVRVAAEKGAPLRDAAQTVSIERQSTGLDGMRLNVATSASAWPVLTLPLLGDHQLENVATAVAACEVLRDEVRVPVPDDALVQGLETTRWDGRFQVLQRDPPVVVDGAHNPDAARVLVRSMATIFKKKPVGLIVGMCADKPVGATLRELGALAPQTWVVPLASPRGMPADDLGRLARASGLTVSGAVDLSDAWEAALAWARKHDGVVCVAGSLFLVGEVLQLWEHVKR